MRIESLCMERDGYRCFRCGCPVNAGTWPGYSCHHRQSRSLGVDTLDNRITLCGSGTTGCHGWVHKNVAVSRDEIGGVINGWIVSRYVPASEIAAIPVRHWQKGLVLLKEGGMEPYHRNGERVQDECEQ